MNKRIQLILAIAFAVTIAAIVLWQATGGDYYTKFQVVGEMTKDVARDDPLAAAGFYEGDAKTETVVRDEFHFGLLPTPSKLLDKHLFSVTSTVIPAWFLAFGSIWFLRRREMSGVG